MKNVLGFVVKVEGKVTAEAVTHLEYPFLAASNVNGKLAVLHFSGLADRLKHFYTTGHIHPFIHSTSNPFRSIVNFDVSCNVIYSFVSRFG